MCKIKILSFILAAIMLISSVNMLAFAEGPAKVSDFESLAAAVESGGDIEVSGYISFEGPLAVTKDTTIKFTGELSMLYMDNSYILSQTGSQAESMFVVEGATLIFDFSESYASVGFNGTGSAIKLVGTADKETAFKVVDSGSLVTNSIWLPDSDGFTYSKSFIDIENPNENKVTVEIDGASISVEKENNTQGNVFSGNSADIKIMSGYFGNTDILEYLDENSVGIEYESGGCEVLKIDAEPLDEVKSYLDNGKLVFKRPKPTEETEMWLLYEELYYGTYDTLENYTLELVLDLFDADSDYAYIKVCEKETGNVVQGLKLPIAYEYEEALVSQVKDIIDALPKGEDGAPYCYAVTDLEMLNFWLTGDESNYYENINNFINYSDEFKKNLDYKNFSANMGYGADDRLYTFCGGMAQFYYNSVSYGYSEIEVKGEHIFYVPDDTADTPEALLEAFKNRVDAYIGEDVIEPEYLGTTLDVLLRDTYEGTRGEWEQYVPNMTFGEWLNSGFCPVIDVENDLEIEGITDTTPIFAVKINGLEHQFLIVKDSSKMTVPQYKNVDFKLDVAVELKNVAIPLDTTLQVEKLTSGETFDKIQEALKPQESETFDIKLRSNALNDYVTSVDGGKFTVTIPIPEEFKGKDLQIRYVHENGQIEEFPETIEGDYIKFPTNHFSAYTLTATDKTSGGGEVNSGGEGGSQAEPKPTTPNAPKTADTRKTELWTALSLASIVLLAGVVYTKKRFEA